MKVDPESVDVSIVFPAYNEADNIASVVLEFAAELSEVNCEIIVVNDGSTDGTAQVLDGLTLPNLRVVQHHRNRGYGAALSSGFSVATGRWTFFTDSDKQFKPTDFHRIWSVRFDNDVVLGYRSNRKDPMFRKMNAWLWSTYVRVIFGVGVKDLNCAFKLFPSQALKKLNLQSTGAFINAEILSGLRRQGLSWTELPVHHYPRLEGVQTGANPKVIVHAFKESWAYYHQQSRML